MTNAPFSGIILHKIDSVTGEGIYNVKFLVYNQNKNPIGEYSTDDQGYIYIDDLTVQGKGKLFIRELEAASGYELDKEYKTVYVQPGKTMEIEWENTPITGQFQIYKYATEYNEVTGTPAGTPLQGAVYEISDPRSNKVVEYITTDAARAAVLTTGTYSARLNYRILYKTNYTTAYQVLASNLITSSNYSFSLNAIPTQAGEYVTDIYCDFGKVPVGFQSVANPTLTVQVLGTVANGYQLINWADAGGKYQGTWQTAQATWVTIVRKLTNTAVPTLPKTGY